MPKRKNIQLSLQPPATTRPRTRSSGSLIETEAVSPRITKVRNLNAADRKEWSEENNGNQSDDDMNLLSPPLSKIKAVHATPRVSPPSTPSAKMESSRLFIEAVEIRTPKSAFKIPQINLDSVPETPTRIRKHIRDRTPSPSPNKRIRFLSPKSHIPSDPGVSSPSPPGASSPNRSSPSKQPLRLPRPLASHLIPHLHSQKQAVLSALQRPPLVEYDSSTYPAVIDQLEELVKGTVERHEGNSCLVLGPRGGGKSRLVKHVLASIPSTLRSHPVIVRLSAHCQTNDRLAMREIARQIHEQLGSSSVLLPNRIEEKDSVESDENTAEMDLPPSSHLPGMIAALPGLGRPVIVVLDAFDGFAAHARQALLYCLLDTVQSCCGGAAPVTSDQQLENTPTDTENEDISQTLDLRENIQDTSNIENKIVPNTPPKGEHGLLVIGITSRVDCLTLLEKRVKSRFSHRIMRIGTPPSLQDFLRILEAVLTHESNPQKVDEEWRSLWRASVKQFLCDKEMLSVMKETFAFGKDLRVLLRLMVSPIISLTPNSPWLKPSQFVASASVQRCPQQFPFLDTLPYPHIALLIAAAHSKTIGHETFNFEMLYDKFMAQVRVSIAAPVQFERGGLGMVNVGRGVMMGAFEDLIESHIFRPAAALSTHITKEFIKYRCIATREDIKNAVEQLGQTNLKKWFSRPQ